MADQREKSIYVDGVFVKSSVAGSGKVKIALDVADPERLISFLHKHKNDRQDGKIFLQLWEKREHNKFGTHDLTLDTWRMNNVGKGDKPQGGQQGATKFTDDSDDLPFK